MPRPIDPSDPEREAELGRVALWLELDDLRWLGTRCNCTEDTPDEEKDRCARIRFRAQAALHKAGLKHGDEVKEPPGTT